MVVPHHKRLVLTFGSDRTSDNTGDVVDSDSDEVDTVYPLDVYSLVYRLTGPRTMAMVGGFGRCCMW